jgi:hypothetical protein
MDKYPKEKTKAEAELERERDRMLRVYCPVINGFCRTDCASCVEPEITQDEQGKYSIIKGRCTNTAVVGESE